MSERNVVIQGIYKHFKNKLYQVKMLALHSETGEKMVVYQALYGDYQYYVRPLEMFLSEVDKDRYPNADQLYRFELADKPSAAVIEEANALHNDGRLDRQPVKDVPSDEEALQKHTADKQRLLLDFLDTEDLNDKQSLLGKYRKLVDNKFIDSIAMTMDITIEEGPVEVRLSQLMSILRTMARYDGSRLRGG